HGVFLGLVSQRPAELDATIISQCSTLLAMRMTNDRDQAILRSAVSDAAANLLDFLPSLGTGEVFAFGEGVALPTRVKLKQLPPPLLQKSDALNSARDETGINEELLAAVPKRWRAATTKLEEGPREAKAPDLVPAAPPQPAPPGDPRANPLKRPLAERLDVARAFQSSAPARRPPEA